MAIAADHCCSSSVSHRGVVGFNERSTIQVGNKIHYYIIVYAASMKVTVSTSQLIMECICCSCELEMFSI